MKSVFAFTTIPVFASASSSSSSSSSRSSRNSTRKRTGESYIVRSDHLDASSIIRHASQRLQRQTFLEIDDQTQCHLRKVLDAMKSERVSTSTFLSADGYGHSDFGRDALDAVYATTFETESALVRIQFMSGTHAIASVLYGVLRPGDEMLCVTGEVYDTLEEVLGIHKNNNNLGSLKDFNISTKIHSLNSDGTIDFQGIQNSINTSTKLVFIQRSFGYSWRPPISISEIKHIVQLVKSKRKDIIIFVDNCYGEFVEQLEPVHSSIGADVMAGSLIKNLGAGLVPSGAYIVGREDIIKKARARLSAPGVGGGATLGLLRCMYQGFFMSPGIVGEALKGSFLIAEVMNDLGYEVMPSKNRASFVRAIKLGSKEKLQRFCLAVQQNGPVGAFIKPTVGITEGYQDQVVFAQGTFIDGSTIELSADGPMREPFVVFAQGGLHWTHWTIVLEDVIRLVGRNEESY